MGKVLGRRRDFCVWSIFWLLSFFGHSFFGHSAHALAGSLPEIDISHLEHRWLRAPVEFLVADDQQDLIEIKTADFQPLGGRDINQGISEKVYWLRLRLRNNSDQTKAWVLHNDTSYLDNLVVYYRDQNASQFQTQHLSDRAAFHDRGFNYRSLSFAHQTTPGGYTDVYLKAYFDKADSMSLNFHLWDEDVFWRTVRDENLIYGGYYGILVILIILSLVFSVLLRQMSALYYAGFLFSTALMWLFLNGYGYQYLWPTQVYWHNEGFHIVFLLFALFALQFSKAFLRTQSFQPKMHRFFTGLQAIVLAALVLRGLGIYGLVLHIAFIMLALLAVVVPLASWRGYRKGLTYARWYTLAWLVYSLSLVISVTSAYTNILQWGMQVLNYLQLGSLLEAIFLMVAMCEWLMSLDTDRRKAIALANLDPLTNLGNRRVLQMQYEVFKEQFLKDGQPVFLIMMDLDYFKQINDSHGHEAGDFVLQKIADLIVHLCRADDVCIRYGGEEFAVLMRADDMEAVRRVAERIRLQFEQIPTEYEGQTIEHTLCSGITPVLSNADLLTVQEMMFRADAALYQGKAAGRNRTTVYDAQIGRRNDDVIPASV